MNPDTSINSVLAKARANVDNRGFLDIDLDPTLDLFAEIERLKKEKNAVVLAQSNSNGRRNWMRYFKLVSFWG